MNDIDTVLGQAIVQILKIDIIESVAISKNNICLGYTLIAYFGSHNKYVRCVVSIEELEMAVDLPERLVYEFQKQINLLSKGEKNGKCSVSNETYR